MGGPEERFPETELELATDVVNSSVRSRGVPPLTWRRDTDQLPRVEFPYDLAPIGYACYLTVAMNEVNAGNAKTADRIARSAAVLEVASLIMARENS